MQQTFNLWNWVQVPKETLQTHDSNIITKSAQARNPYVESPKFGGNPLKKCK